jgi:hypothetical protein
MFRIHLLSRLSLRGGQNKSDDMDLVVLQAGPGSWPRIVFGAELMPGREGPPVGKQQQPSANGWHSSAMLEFTEITCPN